MSWRWISEDGVGAAEGLACDELLARRAGAGESTETLRTYTYRPHAALVGRFQDVAREVDLDYCGASDIEVNRRPTGGGAILMGPDQLGIALTLRGLRSESGGRLRALMERFSGGVVRALAALGIEARFRGKNDLVVGGRKIAGLGVHRAANRGLLFHASVLVDLDVALMARVLRTGYGHADEAELSALAGRTTTICRQARRDVPIDEVRTFVAEGFAAAFDADVRRGELDDDERAAIAELARDRYDRADWVFQRTEVPEGSGAAVVDTPGGSLDARVALVGRTLKAVALRGDFFADEGAVADLEGRLRWHPSDRGAIEATVNAWSAEHPGGTFGPEALVRAIGIAVRRARSEEHGNVPYGCFVDPEAARG